ncbi:Mitochondrial GTPase [Thoreauomyces humboldtii]|nr:Mitochondrial GTPase [Thoreauomyces humboldtii]
MKKPIVDAFRKQGRDAVLFTQADKGTNVKKILEWALEQHRAAPHRYPFLSMVIVGLPNVGKSSLINALRRTGVKKGKASAVGPSAGVTQTIQTRVKIYDDPPIYLVDTPGIFDPHITHPVDGLKIALTGATKDRLTEEQNVADYLLFRLNTSMLKTRYPQVLGLPGPTDDIRSVLTHIATVENFTESLSARTSTTTASSDLSSSMGAFALAFDDDDLPPPPAVEHAPRIPGRAPAELDLQRAARHMVQLFREGAFGPLTLDDCGPAAIERWFGERAGAEPEIGSLRPAPPKHSR